MKNLKNTSNPWLLGLFLGAAGLIAAAVLAMVDQGTAEAAKAAERRTLTAALKQVLPPCEYVSAVPLAFGGVDFYGAWQQGRLVGVAGIAADPRGYGGAIECLAGMFPDGSIRTVLITKHNETPGLGTKVFERKRQKTLRTLFAGAGAAKDDAPPPNPLLDRFAGRTAPEEPWRVTRDGGDCDYVTGATVTSRAVTRAVWKIDHVFGANKPAVIAGLEAAR